MTFCTPIANAQGSHTFKIICTVYHRSSMPCRVIGTQNVNITSREEDRDQGQTPSQTVTLAIFKYFQGWVLTHPFHFSFCIFSTSFFPPSSIIPTPCARDPHTYSGCPPPWITPQDEDQTGPKASALASPVYVMLRYRLALLINS